MTKSMSLPPDLHTESYHPRLALWPITVPKPVRSSPREERFGVGQGPPVVSWSLAGVWWGSSSAHCVEARKRGWGEPEKGETLQRHSRDMSPIQAAGPESWDTGDDSSLDEAGPHP